MPVELGSFSFGFVAGGAVVGVVNHFLAKSRDTELRAAKDFNEAADIMAEMLRKERSCPCTESNIDFFAFRRVLSQKELSRFDRTIEKYEKAKENSAIKYDDENSIYCRSSSRYQDPSSIISAIDELLEFTKRR